MRTIINIGALEAGYKKGICFLCLKPCEAEAYCHDFCARALDESRTMKKREIMERKELI